jgi:hypothetical protein
MEEIVDRRRARGGGRVDREGRAPVLDGPVYPSRPAPAPASNLLKRPLAACPEEPLGGARDGPDGPSVSEAEASEARFRRSACGLRNAGRRPPPGASGRAIGDAVWRAAETGGFGAGTRAALSQCVRFSRTGLVLNGSEGPKAAQGATPSGPSVWLTTLGFLFPVFSFATGVGAGAGVVDWAGVDSPVQPVARTKTSGAPSAQMRRLKGLSLRPKPGGPAKGRAPEDVTKLPGTVSGQGRSATRVQYESALMTSPPARVPRAW